MDDWYLVPGTCDLVLKTRLPLLGLPNDISRIANRVSRVVCVYTGQQSDANPEIPWRQKISKYHLQLQIMYSGVPVAKSVIYLHQLYT